MKKLAIFVNNPYQRNEQTDRLFNYTVENAIKMYPDADVFYDKQEDYRQQKTWNLIYNVRHEYETACVVSTGNVFLKPNQTYDLVMEQTNLKFWWAIGHIIDRTHQGWYLRLFNSCYFINLKEIADDLVIKDNQVYPGYRPSNMEDLPLNGFLRSDDNHHDNYTPWWVKCNPDAEPITDLKQHGGSLLINEGFKNNVQFESFNQAVRDSKEYLYMEYDDFGDQTWKDLDHYFQTGQGPTDEDAPNYWWYDRVKNIQK